MVGIGVVDPDITLRIVLLYPGIATHGHRSEQSACLDLNCHRFLGLLRQGQGIIPEYLRRFTAIHLLDRFMELPSLFMIHMLLPEQGHGSSRSQRLRHSGIAKDRVDPMESRCGDDQVESPFLYGPLLKGACPDFDLRIGSQIAPCYSGKIGPEFDAEQAITAPGEGQGRLSRAGADLQDPASGWYAR